MNTHGDDERPEPQVVVDTSPGAIVAATYETPQPKKVVWPYAVAVIFLLMLFTVTGWFIANLSIRNQHLNTELAEAIDRNEEQDEIILELTKTGQALFDQINAIPGVEPDEPRPVTPVPGTPGPAGQPGEQGEPGETGPPGAVGPPGPGGTNGTDGASGTNGTDGASGADGATGAAGPSGVQGEPGPQGPVGPQGEPGIQGEQGTPGTSAYPFSFQFTYLLVTYSCEVAAPTGTVCTAL